MGKSYSGNSNPGLYVPTTDVFDAQAIYQMNVNSKEFKDFLVRLRNSVNQMAVTLNAKDSGYYAQEEFITGQSWFPTTGVGGSTTGTASSNTQRMTYRKVIPIPLNSITIVGDNPIAHGITITPSTILTRMYGSLTRYTTGPTVVYLQPLPFVSISGAAIELYADQTYIHIKTQQAYAEWQGSVVMEYLQN